MLGLMSVLASEAPNGVMLPGDVNEVYWGSLAFLVVAALLYKLAIPPIAKALRGRSTRIESELGVADAAKAEAVAEADRIQASVSNADQEAARIIADAQEAAVQLRASLRERADQEAVELQVRARADIEAQKLQAIGDLRAEVSSLARGAAEAVVRSNLDDATQADLIDNYINQVGA
jgi:F-type H+-transporting ATPase subunit b